MCREQHKIQQEEEARKKQAEWDAERRENEVTKQILENGRRQWIIRKREEEKNEYDMQKKESLKKLEEMKMSHQKGQVDKEEEANKRKEERESQMKQNILSANR